VEVDGDRPSDRLALGHVGRHVDVEQVPAPAVAVGHLALDTHAGHRERERPEQRTPRDRLQRRRARGGDARPVVVAEHRLQVALEVTGHGVTAPLDPRQTAADTASAATPIAPTGESRAPRATSAARATDWAAR
jgi:hypothetical protein